MAEQLTVEAPEFERIKKGDPLAVFNAINILYAAVNAEARFRRQTVRIATDREVLKVQQSAPAAQQDNFDARLDTGIVEFTGSTAFDLTGIRNGSPGRRLQISVTGSATVTVKDQDANSDATNRIVTDSGTDVAVDQDKSIVLVYLSDRWRELKLA